MASLEYVAKNLGDSAGRLLILMQEGDEGGDPFTYDMEWAGHMYEAYEHVKKALEHVREAAKLAG